MPNLSASDIDAGTTSQRFAGSEDCTDAATPAKFQQALIGCGALVS